MSAFAIVMRDPLLRLVVLALFLTGVAVSSVMPFASLIAVERLGLSDNAYSLVLTISSSAMVIASVVVGIFTDQHANRRQMLAVGFAIAAIGHLLVFFTRSPLAFVVAHTALLPLGFSVFSISQVTTFDVEPTLFSSLDLPREPFDLSLITSQNHLVIQDPADGFQRVNFVFTNVEITVIPTPATGVLAILSGICARNRRRR